MVEVNLIVCLLCSEVSFFDDISLVALVREKLILIITQTGRRVKAMNQLTLVGIFSTI